MKLLKQFIQQETVLTAAAVLAVISAFFLFCRMRSIYKASTTVPLGDFVFSDDGHGRAAAARAF